MVIGLLILVSIQITICTLLITRVQSSVNEASSTIISTIVFQFEGWIYQMEVIKAQHISAKQIAINNENFERAKELQGSIAQIDRIQREMENALKAWRNE